MNAILSRICFVFLCLLGMSGCAPQENEPPADPSLRGLKLSDLQPSASSVLPETRLNFTVLTYELDNASLDRISGVFRRLIWRDITYADKTAFDANGFIIGWGPHARGSQVAKELDDIGARQTRRSRMVITPETHEVLSDDPVEAHTLVFPTSHKSIGKVSVPAGRLGWLLSAQLDPQWPQEVSVQFEPAFWSNNLTDLRVLAGKVPFKYQTFAVGRARLKLQPGQLCVLAPAGTILQPQTLSRMLFEVNSEKTRLFVVILDKVGN